MNVPAEWAKARREFMKNNPPNHQGYWECKRCGKWTDSIEVDHIIPRSRDPSLRFEQANLQVLCPKCNSIKGSSVRPPFEG